MNMHITKKIGCFSAILLAISGNVAAQSQFMKVVAADGTGDYTTIQSAIDACSKDGTRNFVFIKNGTYNEQVTIPSGVVLSLLGEDRDKVVITHKLSHNDGSDKSKTSTLYVTAYDMYGENFTTENTVGRNGGQAECMTNDGDRLTLRNVSMKANQDGVRFDNASRSYLVDCYIEGTVDYIYDSGIAYLDNCTIKQLYPGYIIAPGDSYVTIDRNTSYERCGQKKIWGIGINIRDSKLIYDEANVGKGASALGRPWGKTTSSGMFIRCKMDKHIKDAGFDNMSEGNKKYIGEYKSMDLDGNAIDVSKRIEWEFTEDPNHNAQYIDQKVIDNIYDMDYIFTLAGEKGARAGGKFDPIPLVIPAAAPTDITVNGGKFQWTPAADALGYLIYKDGAYLANTTASTFEDKNYSASSKYTLRSISKTGCMGEFVDMTTTGIETIKAKDTDITVSADGIHFGEDAYAALYSLDGHLVSSAQGMSIGWTNAAKGCYILKIRTVSGNAISKKIIRK